MNADVLSALGNWSILPGAMLALAGYLIALFTGLHGTRVQLRTKFLELWPGALARDDMFVEVTVRHGFGSYIPASVIRRACQLDHCADRILHLSQLWPLLQHERPCGRVRWLKAAHENPASLAWAERGYTALYFAISLIAFAFASAALELGHQSILAWMCGMNALLFLVVAFGMLAKAEMFSLARKQGDRYIAEINLEHEDSGATDTMRATKQDELAPSRGPLPDQLQPL